MSLLILDFSQDSERCSREDAQLAVGDQLLIIVAETATTGYRWALESGSGAHLRLTGDENETPAAARVGGRRTRTFSFDALAAGAAQLRLSCRRAFDPEQEPVGKRVINITVVERRA